VVGQYGPVPKDLKIETLVDALKKVIKKSATSEGLTYQEAVKKVIIGNFINAD